MRRVLLAGLLATACLALAPGVAPAKTIWLCRPGMEHDPCSPRLSTTVFDPWGVEKATKLVTAVSNRGVDCFYVYPTVSNQPTTNATRARDPELTSVALYQAARYSQRCRVYAPVYRQITLAALGARTFTAADGLKAYGDVLAAWRDYWTNVNGGRRPFVLIGHSQGSGMLERLIAREIETKASVYDRMVAAYVLGGNVVVPKGKDVGGTFKKVRACRSDTQLHCVVAFSTFAEQPPADSTFGRTGGLIGTAFRQPSGPAYEVLCTNPASLRGGSGTLDTIVPVKPFAPGGIALGIAAVGIAMPKVSTTFVEAPRAFTGRCSKAGGASVLRITPTDGTPRPGTHDPGWGLHLFDGQVAQGNLVALMASQIRAYESAASAVAGGAGS